MKAVLFVGLLCCIFLVGAPAGCFAAGESPEIVFSVELPDAMVEALHEFSPDFAILGKADFHPDIIQYWKAVMPKGIPWAVIGDFNGDEIDDVALMGIRNDKENEADKLLSIVVILSTDTAYRVDEIFSSDAKYWKRGKILELLAYQQPDTIYCFSDREPVQLKHDAFELVYFEKAATLYWFDTGVLDSCATAD